MNLLLLMGLLAANPAYSAEPTKLKETIEMVEAFLKLPTAELPHESIPAFIAIDAKTLPERLRDRYRAKRAELLALRSISDGKRKPPVRRMDQAPIASCDREEASPQLVKFLLQMGFEKIYPEEVAFLEERTKCNECELVEEFALKVVTLPPKSKKEKPAIQYLMAAGSPAMALIAQRRGGRGSGTDFFGMNFLGACRSE